MKGKPTHVETPSETKAKGAQHIVDIVVDDVSTVENYHSSFPWTKEGMDGLIRGHGTGKVVDSGGSEGHSSNLVRCLVLARRRRAAG